MIRRVRRLKREKADPRKTQNEFNAFKKKMTASKHSFWFDVLDAYRKFKLFLLWKEKKHQYKIKGDKPISFHKFMFSQRSSKKFHVPVSRIRDSAINKILN